MKHAQNLKNKLIDDYPDVYSTEKSRFENTESNNGKIIIKCSEEYNTLREGIWQSIVIII
jgi:hypothetical protein